MKNSFIIPLTDAAPKEKTALMAKLVSATGSELEAESIFRTMQRMGSDPTILGYEMTLLSRGPRNGGVATSAWRVRAQRLRPVVEPTPEATTTSAHGYQRR